MKLVVFVDALSFEVVLRIKKNLNDYFKYTEPMESILGYSSGIKPTIWTGLSPIEHNSWNDFYISEKKIQKLSQNKFFYKLFQFFPHKFSRAALSAFNLLSSHLFNYVYPPGLEPTLIPYISRKKGSIIKNLPINFFNILDKDEISYLKIFDPPQTEKMMKKITLQKKEVIYLDFSSIDKIGHVFGPNTKQYEIAIVKLMNFIGSIIKKQEMEFLIFSDHGMTEVKNRIDFHPFFFINSSLRYGKDYICFLDSTMGRFWFSNSRIKSILKEEVNAFYGEVGHFLSNKELKDNCINFQNREFFDSLFLLESGNIFYPNAFHAFFPSLIRGMHGYKVTDKSSYGVYISSQRNSEEKSILGMYTTLRSFIEDELE